MRPSLPTVFSVVCLAGAALYVSAQPTLAQSEPRSVLSVAVGAGAPAASVAELDARITEMVATGRLVRTSATADPLAGNRQVEYFAQMHQGIPVYGGGVNRQQIDGVTVSALGTLYLGIDVGPRPLLAADVAMMRPRERGVTSVAPGGDVTMVVLPEFSGRYRLTYRATFLDGKVRFVDASSGDLVRTEDAFVHQQAVGTGNGAHGDLKKIAVSGNGGSYEALDLFRPAQIRTRTTQASNPTVEQLLQGVGATALDTDNVWVNPSVVDAHVNAGLAYDYFHQAMGWQGLDGANAPIDQVVTDRVTIENNAFFAPPTSSASSTGVIGFGVSSAGYPMASLDIVGHELMHGVTFFSLRRRTGTGLISEIVSDGLGPTEATSNGQTFSCATTEVRFEDGTTAPFLCSDGRYVLGSNHGGAINEGFSDVFGTAIEFRFQPPGNAALRADYYNGEDVVPGGPASSQIGGIFRSLINPTSVPIESTGALRYPDHIDGRIRYTAYVQNNLAFVIPLTIVNGSFVNVSIDNGGVHANATLMGHVFYRAIEGGTHRVSGRTVPGVGAANRELIEKVFFRAMTTLMPATARFQTAAAALRQAAVDLHGASSAAYRAIDESLLAAGL